MSYQDRLCAHLAAYKRTSLGIQEPGVFRYRGVDVLRDHILPTAQADLNLLPLARDLVALLGPQVKRHQFFHHLNSSQAFAFNLFLPFFNNGDAAATALLTALGHPGRLSSWLLEAIPVEAEGTNIDAMWVTEGGTTTFCEVKLSESDFGKATLDDRHRQKLAKIYSPVLRGHVSDEALEELRFFASYQVLRNVWHMIRNDGAALVFLLPRANTMLWAELPVLLEPLRSDVRARVRIVAIEDVFASLEADVNCPGPLRSYAGELAAKYLCK